MKKKYYNVRLAIMIFACAVIISSIDMKLYAASFDQAAGQTETEAGEEVQETVQEETEEAREETQEAQEETQEETQAEAKTSKKAKTRFIAHRGLSSEVPENTARAFILAGEAGFWGCETDVYRTRDGEFVCSHDDSLMRMAGIEANITELTYRDLENVYFIAGANYESYRDDLLALTIPKLEDYLSICKIYQMVPIIEIKELDENWSSQLNGESDLQEMNESEIEQAGIDDSTESSKIDVTYSKDLYEYVDEIMEGKPTVYISHNIEQLQVMKAFAEEDNRKRYHFMLLTTEITDELEAICQENGFFINSRYSGADEEAVSQLEEDGLHVGIWTLNRKSQVKAFYNAGATFITTDRVFWENNKME